MDPAPGLTRTAPLQIGERRGNLADTIYLIARHGHNQTVSYIAIDLFGDRLLNLIGNMMPHRVSNLTCSHNDRHELISKLETTRIHLGHPKRPISIL